MFFFVTSITYLGFVSSLFLFLDPIEESNNHLCAKDISPMFLKSPNISKGDFDLDDILDTDLICLTSLLYL